MDDSDGIICRFCFKLSKLGFEVTDLTKLTMNNLLNGKDWYLSQDALICQNCDDTIKKSCQFKSMCDTKKTTLNNPISTTRECIFCKKQMDVNNYVSINIFFGTEILNRISEFMPELGLGTLKNPVTCVNCGENCESYIKFASNFMEKEKAIKTYFERKGLNSNDNHVKLSEIYNYIFGTEEEIKDIKQEPNMVEEKTDFNTQNKFIGLQREVDIKKENGSITSPENNSLNSDGFSWERAYEIYRSNESSHSKDSQSSVSTHTPTHGKKREVTLFKCKACPFETKYKRCFKRHIISHEEFFKAKVYEGSMFKSKAHEGSIFKEKYKCPLCSYETYREAHLKSHTLTHKKVGDAELFKCEFCPFETKWKISFRRHISSHQETPKAKVPEKPFVKEVYKCALCSYETFRKSNFKSHTLSHKKVGDTPLFKCESCPFETKWERSFKRHVMSHQDIPRKTVPEIPVITEIYKCAECSYETFRKSNFKSHTLSHKKIGDATLFKCESCPFETKWRISFKRHVASHEENPNTKVSETSVHETVYKCSVCPYETFRKSNFKSHALTHKTIDDIGSFKCKKCPFETKWKRSFKRHVMSHEQNSEPKVYDYQDIPFETDLGLHWLTYKDDSETVMYKCSCCTYETKWRTNLKKHELTHENESETQNFICEYCLYETDCYKDLKNHAVVHEEAGTYQNEVMSEDGEQSVVGVAQS